MSKTLLVPIHTDALCLKEDKQAVRAMVDYTLLPYKYKEHTYNSGSENLSKTALGPLFNHEFTLKKGIHLHWSLPDALTNGQHDSNGTTFPVVPNRWLIVRKGGETEEKTWVIESDYLYPELDPNDSSSSPPNAINILIQPPDLATVDPKKPDTYQYQRYRYMGKCWELSQWPEEGGENPEYAEELTAMGNQATIPIFDEVKATFAAFYPNCHSVFGFHDPEYDTDTPPGSLQYDVIGWYSDAEDDCLKQFFEANSCTTAEEFLQALQEQFYWTFEDVKDIPHRTLYHSRITFTGEGGSWRKLDTPTPAIGNSESEAISAYLAYEFNGDNNELGKTVRKSIQDTLETLQLSERLESRKLDLDAKFREGRHERGFGAQNEGVLWLLMPQSSQLDKTKTTTGLDLLPDHLAQLLNELNALQEDYNQAWLDIGSLRDRLYSQWYYSMLPKTDDTNFYNTFYQTSLIPLRTAIAQTGELEFTQDEKGNTTVTTKTLPFGIVSWLNTYFSDYVDTMQAATTSSFDNWESIIQLEFDNCGVKISENPTVTAIENQEWAWEIQDNGLTYPVKVEGGIFTIYIPPSEAQVAFNLVNKLNELSQAITTYNENSATQYQLRTFPTQSYWRGNDPVILLAGESTKSPLRFGQDGRLHDDDLLECIPLDFDVTTIIKDHQDLLDKINSLQPDEGKNSINFITWTQQPWNPFAFHWSVMNYPCRDIESSTVQDYNPNQILDNYELQKNAIDLKLIHGKESSFISDGNTYSGFSILTPSAGTELTLRLSTYLNEQLLPNYYSKNNISEENQTPNYLDDNLDQITQWYTKNNYLENNPQKQAADPTFIALWAYAKMKTLDCQAQMLGGFNDTLLLGQPTLQLQVDDPLYADDIAQLITEQVRWSLGNRLQHKILSGDIFNPIRSGGFSVKKLWLIDSFGQYQEVVNDSNQTTKIVTTYQMTPADKERVNYQAILPPRIAQSSRLNFHWLSADALQEVEYTKIPAKTPVCGWIVPNNLDSNLAIYDNQGRSLGSIDLLGNWRNAPGVTLSRDNNGYPLLENHHLQKLVHHLLEQGKDFQQQFLSTVDNALETIDPESFAQNTGLALLVGRPMAIVRATFSLEVKGLPACDPTVLVQEENEFPSYGFTGVQVPIRLGDYQQLNDGLVGYWKEIPKANGIEGDYEYENNIFYATQSNLVDSNNIITDSEGIVHFLQNVDAEPQSVTMLIDPRGLVHASCGVLPNQELRLPSEHYNQALEKMEVNFLSTPILSNSGELAMPLSPEANATWSWVSLTKS
ncbi:MAG: hypothetical protein O4752_07605, partial [Trichodesmium sp. St4_bin8_1]|nr:hypothetical protein [Trichodesmium sp. St4_bin8_1]